MKKIVSAIVLLFAFGQGLWAAPQTWESGNTICALENGLFTVMAKPGTDGAMADYHSVEPDWRDCLSTVSEVVVLEGVTVIGEYALPNLPDVEISLPNTLKEIHTDAFRYGNMSSITIPKSVTKVAAGAFYCCDQLADVYCLALPNQLTWGSTLWDFKHSPDYWTYETRMHVMATYLDAFKEKFTGARKLNVTFVGDIRPASNWKYNRASSFSDIDEELHELKIHNEAELALFAYNVNNGVDYSIYGIFLEADLDLSDYLWTPIGNEEHPLRALLFDGNEHTIEGLCVLNPEGDYNGLFGNVKGTKIEGYFPDAYDDGQTITIKDLKVINSIVNGRNYTGGVIGKIYGTCFVQNVYSDAKVAGADNVGGVIGLVESQMDINLHERYGQYLPTIENNAYVGSSVTATGENHGVVMGGRVNYIKSQHNYYINSAVSAVANADDEMLYPIRTVDIPDGVTINITATKSMEWEGIQYVGSNAGKKTCDLTLDVKCGYTMLITAVNLNDEVVATDEGTYTLQPVIGSATEYVVSVTANASGIEGKGTETEPYIIDTVEEWDIFANLVSSGHPTLGLYFQLGADLTITTMTGSSPANSFAGYFDGNNKTLTLDYRVTDDYAAPFRYISGGSWDSPSGATIKNLHVAGNIDTSAKFAAGIAGYVTGINCTIENCRSSVAINSSVEGDGTHGGLVANIYRDNSAVSSIVDISGCVFDGKLLGNNTTHCGGLIGWANMGLGRVALTNCLFAPAEVTIGADNSATYFRASDYQFGSMVSNCFYTEELGTMESVPASYTLTVRPANFGTESATYSVSGITATTGGIAWDGKFFVSSVGLYSDASNDDLISDVATHYGNKPVNVTLCGRTLYKDGSWNTLCLPFNVTISGSPLDGDGVDVRTLDTASFEAGTLKLNFTHQGDVTTMEAGKPYVIKWDGGSNLTETNLVFGNVTIENGMNDVTCDLGNDRSVAFMGTYKKLSFDADDRTVLYLGADNTLYYPKSGTSIGAQRAYFKLSGLTAGDLGSDINSFALNFGDGTNSIGEISNLKSQTLNSTGWYSLDGRKLPGKPTQKGIYIKNGKRYVMM